jgi:hypothetical protein
VGWNRTFRQSNNDPYDPYDPNDPYDPYDFTSELTFMTEPRGQYSRYG